MSIFTTEVCKTYTKLVSRIYLIYESAEKFLPFILHRDILNCIQLNQTSAL